MRAISSFSFDTGMSTRRWPAWQALRTRVSMSATGSITFISPSVRYQLALRTPGISPRSASSRKQMRHSLKARSVPRLRQGRVVAAGARDEGNVHPVDLLDLVVVDLRENHLLLEPDGVVAPPVEALGREPPEVAHARHRDADEAIQELVHPGAAQRHRAADRLPLPQVEIRDRLLGARYHGPLAGDRGELGDGGLQALGVLGRVAHPDVHDDLHE